jgi:hypothetical protein
MYIAIKRHYNSYLLLSIFFIIILRSCDRASCDRASCDRASCDRASCDRASCDRAS